MDRRKAAYYTLGKVLYKLLLPVTIALLCAWAYTKRLWGSEFTPLASRFFAIAFVVIGIALVGTIVARLILKRYS